MNKYNFLLVLLTCLSSNGTYSADDQPVKDIIEKTAEYFVLANAALHAAGAGAVVATTKVLGSAPLRYSVDEMKSMQRDISKAIMRKMPLMAALAVGVAIMKHRL